MDNQEIEKFIKDFEVTLDKRQNDDLTQFLKRNIERIKSILKEKGDVSDINDPFVRDIVDIITGLTYILADVIIGTPESKQKAKEDYKKLNEKINKVEEGER